MTCGIYRIVNMNNGHFYLGSSVIIENRYVQHMSDLRCGRHHSVYLQRAYDKDSENVFILDIVEECDESELLEIEQTYLDAISSSGCYNVSRSASGGDLVSHHPDRDEIRSRMAKTIRSWLGAMTADERKLAFGKPGEKNPNWQGGVYAERCTCACGNIKAYNAETCHECRDRTGENNPFFGNTHSKKTKQKLSQLAKRRYENGVIPGNARKVMIDRQEYESVTEAARQLGVVPATIIYRIKSKHFDNYSYLD